MATRTKEGTMPAVERKPQPDFRVSEVDSKLIRKIVARTIRDFTAMDMRHPDRLTLEMDLTAVHTSIGLRLSELLEADAFNFIHDVAGIFRHMNRQTGELGGHFSPRFSVR